MATINPTYSFVGSGEHTVVATWATFATADTLTPVGSRWADYSDRSVQLEGTFGGTVTMQGSNDGTNYQSLTDPQGNAIAKSAGAIEAISEATLFVRPSCGVGVTATTVTLVMRRGRGGLES